MSLGFSTALRNFMLDSGLQTAFDTDGILELRTGTRPGSADTAPVGTVIVAITLTSNVWQAAASGAIAKDAGAWVDSSADATGVPTWFRLRRTGDAGTTNTTDRRMDGDVGEGSGDLSLNNTDINAGQEVEVTQFTVTQPA